MGAWSRSPEVLIPQELQVKAVWRQESKLAGVRAEKECVLWLLHSLPWLQAAESTKDTFAPPRTPFFWCHPALTPAKKFYSETLTGRKSVAFRPMGSFLAAGITDSSALVTGVEEAIGGLWIWSGCRRNWDKSSSGNNMDLASYPLSWPTFLSRQSPIC